MKRHPSVSLWLGSMALFGFSACVSSGSIEQLAARVQALEQGLEAQARTIARLKALPSTLAPVKAQLEAINKRLGLSPLSALKSAPSDMHVALPSATLLQGPSKPAIERSIARTLGPKRGYVLAFWATWCKPCIADEELHHLEVLRKALDLQDVALISMAIDDLEKVRAHPKASQWLYPLWHVQDGHINMLPREFINAVGLGLPLFLVLDRQGQVRWYRQRQLDEQAVGDFIHAAAQLR